MVSNGEPHITSLQHITYQPVIALDMESILTPEIWCCVADRTGISDLTATTRDIPDYDDLMRFRLNLVKRHDLRMGDLLSAIEAMEPLPGARKFLDSLRVEYLTIIVTDTFRQFTRSLMRKLNWPTMFCHELTTDQNGCITGYCLRNKEQKSLVVGALRSLGYNVIAVGDSYNDLSMLKQADTGILFCPPDSIANSNQDYLITSNYIELRSAIDESLVKGKE